MEIIRGSLDDISRPASSEPTGSRVSSVSLSHSDRICPTAPFSLVVLSNDAADIQVQSSSEETMTQYLSNSNPDNCHSFTGNTNDEDDDDLKLQKAIEEMIRLDEMLTATICRQQEAKRQRMEIREQLWQELLQQNSSEGHHESPHEAQNTKLFLALEAPTAKGSEEEKDFEPVFETQVLDSGDRDEQHVAKRANKSENTIKSLETDGVEIGGEELLKGNPCGASRVKKKQKDFVKRNIELLSGEGGQVPLTQTEKERLAELLREIDEEEDDSGAEGEGDIWAVSVSTGQGYTPELPDLKQLNDIDSRIRRLLPDEEFMLLQGSHVHLSGSQGHGSEVGWTCDGDLQPGEKVLQDIKERRGQERRLQEIQQQLEILGQSQEMTDESPDLSEEQLLTLLEECELTESWSQDLEMNTP